MFIKQSSLCLQVFQDDCAEVTSSGGDVVRHLLCRGGMFFMNGSPQYSHNVSLKKGLICFIILAHPVNASTPTLGAKNVTQYYTNTVPQVHWVKQIFGWACLAMGLKHIPC